MSDVRVEVELAHPADVVWRAFTERSLMNEWFIPTDLAPVAGEVYRAFPPTGMAGFTGPFDVDILEVVEPERLRMRWRGEQLFSEVVWELSESDPGVSLAVVQSGFLGLSGDQRRVELAETYEILFRQKLPLVLRKIAKPLTKKPPKPKPPKRPKPPSGERWWRRLAQMPTDGRGGMLSFASAPMITGLIATTLAVTVLARPPALTVLSPPPALAVTVLSPPPALAVTVLSPPPALAGFTARGEPRAIHPIGCSAPGPAPHRVVGGG